MMEMLEVANEIKDLEGCPRTAHTRVGDFMKGIQDDMRDIPEWVGELYLELHRGTLTSIGAIKRANRKAEFALRDAEFLWTVSALQGGSYPSKQLDALWKILLLNQFHDILPGSSIAEVNDEAIRSLGKCLDDTRALSTEALKTFGVLNEAGQSNYLAVNTLSWERTQSIVLDNTSEGLRPESPDIKYQWIKDFEGNDKIVLEGITIPAMGSVTIPMVEGNHVDQESPFTVEDNTVETPCVRVVFDSSGRIISFIEKSQGREIVKPGGALNTFWLGEDIPNKWDNWEIDRDQRLKMELQKSFEGREVVFDGPLQLRLRSRYTIGKGSTLIQDMVFHSNSPQVDFETLIDWSEKHKLFKVGFELDLLTEFARHEIQYGHTIRPTHQNLPQDRARFEVCAHKWTDLSETEFGVALLNDCKYGVGVDGCEIRLSLIKSGLHPDPRGDEGRHRFTYSILPHACGFSVESVVRPAYELNVPVVTVPVNEDVQKIPGLVSIDAPNVIVESVKWAEEEDAFVIRLYEAGKTGTRVNLNLGIPVRRIWETNLLEENPRELDLEKSTVTFFMKPFEIKTLMVVSNR